MSGRFFCFKRQVLLTVIAVGVSLSWCASAKNVEDTNLRGGVDVNSMQSAVVGLASMQQVKNIVMKLQGLGYTDQEIIEGFEAVLADHVDVNESAAATASRTLDLVVISLALIGLDFWNEYEGEGEDWDASQESKMTAAKQG